MIPEHDLLVNLLLKLKDLFDGTLGDWQTEPVSFRLKEGTTPYHGQAYPVPQVHKKTRIKEME